MVLDHIPKDAPPPPDRLDPTAAGPRRRPGHLYGYGWFAARQVLNAKRYLAALAPIQAREFGENGPSAAHIRATNDILKEVTQLLSHDVSAFEADGRELANGRIKAAAFLNAKDRIYARSKEAEKLLAFYRGIFGQRQGRFGTRLGAMDRISLDCYQAFWLGLGKARSVPAPPPLTYIEDGSGPATFRRGVKLTKLGRRPNPFPLVKVPQHRLHNPWTLGAIPHEVAHNLQNDLGLWGILPRRIRAAMQGKLPEPAIRIWMKLHKESYADLAGVLLIGPAYVESLIDVVGKRPAAAAAFNPDGVHPSPIVRVPMNCALLRRMGFRPEADAFERTWKRIYPDSLKASLPDAYRKTLGKGIELMVDACCYHKEAAYGGKALSEVVRYAHREEGLVREAAERLIRGENTGVLPERFLISAAQIAIRKRPDDPAKISRNFYLALRSG